MRSLLLVLALGSTAAWHASLRPAALRSRRAASPLLAEGADDDVVFEFGDAAGVSGETIGAIATEERELTEKEKEIARLRAAEKFMMQDTGDAVCSVCNFKYNWEVGATGVPKRTPFEMIPDSWTCPSYKSPKAFFKPVQIEIAGFADNQGYGIGSNSWTEAQKSNAIFGGLGAFFLLFIAGYGLN